MAMRVTYLVLDGEIISENRNGVERDYLPDPQGNTIALLDNTQTKTDTFTYWPYGEVKTRTGTTPTPFQYGGTWGYYIDSSSRLYARRRVEDAVKGRWMTEGPIGFRGKTWNLYEYCKASPISFKDPTGLAPCVNYPCQDGDDCKPWAILWCEGKGGVLWCGRDMQTGACNFACKETCLPIWRKCYLKHEEYVLCDLISALMYVFCMSECKSYDPSCAIRCQKERDQGREACEPLEKDADDCLKKFNKCQKESGLPYRTF